MAFESVLVRTDVGSRTTRRLTVAAVGALQGALIGLAVLGSFWSVGEVEPPKLAFLARPFTSAPPAQDGRRDEPARAEPPRRARSVAAGSRRALEAPASPPAPRPAAASDAAQVVPGVEVEPGTPGPPGAPGPENASGGGGHGPSEPGDGPDRALGGAARLTPPEVGEKHCLACPPPHVPPPLLRVAGELVLLAKICVRADGSVDRVSILRGITPDVDARAAATIQGWRFQPMSVAGRPVPFCYVTRFRFTLAP
jgi:hypothetical protein